MGQATTFPTRNLLPPGVRFRSSAFSMLSTAVKRDHGIIDLKGDSNFAPFNGTDSQRFDDTFSMSIANTIMNPLCLNNPAGPFTVVAFPFATDTATNSLSDAPNVGQIKLETFGMVRIIGPENNENNVTGSPWQSWIQPRTPGSDNATAGTGFNSAVYVRVRFQDNNITYFRNSTKFAICYELQRAGAVAIAAGNQPGFDDSNASIAGGVTYGSAVNQAATFQVQNFIANTTTPGDTIAGAYTGATNVSCSYTGGTSTRVGPVWTQWFESGFQAGRDSIIRIIIPTGFAVKLFGIAIATPNAPGQNRSGVEAPAPSWALWSQVKSGQSTRQYSPIDYNDDGTVNTVTVTAEQSYRRFYAAFLSKNGTALVSGAPLGGTGVPALSTAGCDIVIDGNGVNDFNSTTARFRAQVKATADALNALGIPYIKIMPPCVSLGAATIADKNAFQVKYTEFQTAMRELVNECPNMILVDTWEALGNPSPQVQHEVHKLNPSFVVANSPSFDGQHFSKPYRDLACGMLQALFQAARNN